MVIAKLKASKSYEKEVSFVGGRIVAGDAVTLDVLDLAPREPAIVSRSLREPAIASRSFSGKNSNISYPLNYSY